MPVPGGCRKWSDGHWHPIELAEACTLLETILSETIDFKHAVPQANKQDVPALAREIVAPICEVPGYPGSTRCPSGSTAIAFVAHDLQYSYSHTALAFLAADRANLVLVVASDVEG
jgi:hypothetical protein